MMKKICFVINAPIMIEPFLGPHIRKLSSEYEVHVATAFEDEYLLNNSCDYIPHNIPIKRDISLTNDFRALRALLRLCRQEDFTVLLSVTPKAALLSAVAGFFSRVKCRIHFFTGQVWTNMTGAKRKMLMLFDKVVVLLDTAILADGHSQRKYLIDMGIVKESKISVLGSGSVSGVDIERFKPLISERIKIRKELNISEDDIVYVFVGRINKDKGINELISAFNNLQAKDNNIRLLLVGYDEGNYSSLLSGQPNNDILFIPPTPNPEHYLQAADIFCCPSYREGFGLSVIEASSTQLPVICSDVYGIMDAMVDDVTGLRCHVKDVDSLYNCMLTLKENSNLRCKLGQNGRKRVEAEFTYERVASCLKDFLSSIVNC